MQNEPNRQPTPEPEQPVPAQPEQLATNQPDQPAAAPVQAPTPPAPVQSPTQPGPNTGQPADLSAQKLLEDYEADRDRHDLGKIMVIGSALMVIGGISLWPLFGALLVYGPAFLVMYLSAPAVIGVFLLWTVTAVSGALLVFRKELGRVAARIVAAVQLVYVFIDAIMSFTGTLLAIGLGSDRSVQGSYISIVVLMLLAVVFYAWVFMFLRKQSVRNLFRP